ncbi:locomotion-related protein Hikaru genki-like, partial [Limulus polyphemus]|uniref:Locomotion-related protein Hikaru genki-like n=1 Tax=Limulus polyphemus TaxID=6850 RepID=A0ABM1RWT8_LIMPO
FKWLVVRLLWHTLYLWKRFCHFNVFFLGDETVPFNEKDNQTCTFRNVEPHLVAFLGDKKVASEVAEFEPGSELVFRCRDIGKFSLVGSVRRKCRRGEWTGMKPSCFGLSQENDYALEKPPTILFRHQLGPIAQSNDGKLVVYPGTILHLECLWIRKYGTPKWEVSHSYRKYPEGWTNEPGRDPQLEYRLSIYHAQKDDSGQFTCITPMGHRHYVNIIVSGKNFQMNLGLSKPMLSHDFLALECTEMTNDTGGLLIVHAPSREVMAKATFSCPVGYGLKGEAEVTCLDNGTWSAPVPECKEVICSPPPTPQNGFLQTGSQKQYKGGEYVQFACHSGKMMVNPGIIVCQENGRWSGPPPKCVPACTYPGTTEGGMISDVKFFYQTNENVTFDCAEEFELRGERVLYCQEDGRWSSTIPTCHPIRRG